MLLDRKFALLSIFVRIVCYYVLHVLIEFRSTKVEPKSFRKLRQRFPDPTICDQINSLLFKTN